MAKKKDNPNGKPKRKQIGKEVARTEHLPPKIPNVTVKPEIDEDAWGEDGLTMRQRAFVAAIVGPAGGNATKAAEMAGYASENREALKTTASITLSKANVGKAIARALAKRNLTTEWTKERLADLASADMGNFVSVGPDGEPKLDFAKASAIGAIGQIKEYSEEGIKVEGSEAQIIKRKIKLHDPNAALANMLKLFGLARDAEPSEAAESIEYVTEPILSRPDEDADKSGQ